MFLQLAAESDLGAVLAGGPVVGQDEVGVAAVQDRQLAERVGHGLVGMGHLEGKQSHWSNRRWRSHKQGYVFVQVMTH